MKPNIPTSGYPLTWPAGRPRTPRENRTHTKFHTRDGQRFGGRDLSLAEARTRLMDEIRAFTPRGRVWRIDLDEVVISSNIRLRADGLPRSGEKEPEDRGVAVYFLLDGRPHVVACDRYWSVAGNLAAIAAHIGATRAIERWGCGDLAELFRGFAQLPPPERGWREVLEIPDDATPTPASVDEAFRRLVSVHHPDRGGSVEKMQALNRARERAHEELGG